MLTIWLYKFKRNKIVWVTLGVIFVLASFFIFSFNKAYADDDNTKVWQCGPVSCDTDSAICSYYSLDWTDQGYPDSYGNSDCCGDDSGEENYITTDCDGNAVSFCCPDELPYVQDNQCVWGCIGDVENLQVTENYWDPDLGRHVITWQWDMPSTPRNCGTCQCEQCEIDYNILDEDGDSRVGCSGNYVWEAGEAITLSLDTTGVCPDGDPSPDPYLSNEEHCIQVMPVALGTRQNPEMGDGGLGGNPSGDYTGLVCATTGSEVCGDNSYNGTEYDNNQSECNSTFKASSCDVAETTWDLDGSSVSGCTTDMCCGDDTGEYVITQHYCWDQTMPTCITCDTNVPAGCCNESTDCSHEGQCYNTGEIIDWYGLKVVCDSDSVWYNCDDDGRYSLCGDALCGSSGGVYAGEIGSYQGGVWDYQDTSSLECCGDDSSEYYAQLCPGVTGADRKCCDSSDDYIDSSGNCVPLASCPPNITLVSPNDGDSCQNVPATTLVWDSESYDGTPLQFHIYHSTIQSDVENMDNSAYVDTITSETYDITIDYYATYYWRVVADNSSQQTASDVWSYDSQVCDGSDSCCHADGCSLKSNGDQPDGYTDSYQCTGTDDCYNECDIEQDDYYCNGIDSQEHLDVFYTGTTCTIGEKWDGADGCDATLCGNECSPNNPCATQNCAIYDPTVNGDPSAQGYYQTRADTCTSGSCESWSSYDTCQNSFNNCTGDVNYNQVECYEGNGCLISNDQCYCDRLNDYEPNPSNPGHCQYVGPGPTVDFSWCSDPSDKTTIQFTSSVSDGTPPYQTYEWDFGDGSCSGGSPAEECDDINPVHNFASQAVYTVELVVTDSDSHPGQVSKSVDISLDQFCSDINFNFNSANAQSSSVIALNWESSEAALNYDIYRDDILVYNLQSSAVCSNNSCSHQDTGLTPGTTYEYAIVAQNHNLCNSLSSGCDGATGSPPNCPCPISETTKSDVTGLNVDSFTCGQIEVGWDDLGADYSYHIYRDIDSVSDIDALDELDSPSYSCDGSTCSFVDKDIIPEQVYYYKITSEKEGSESLLSDASAGSAYSYCFKAPTWQEK